MQKAEARSKRLKQEYNLTPAQWNKMFKLQDGKCPICLKPILKPGNAEGKRAGSVDHDHKTKRVRGILCYRCNRFVIGRNHSDRAKRVYDYLTSSFDGREL